MKRGKIQDREEIVHLVSIPRKWRRMRYRIQVEESEEENFFYFNLRKGRMGEYRWTIKKIYIYIYIKSPVFAMPSSSHSEKGEFVC